MPPLKPSPVVLEQVHGALDRARRDPLDSAGGEAALQLPDPQQHIQPAPRERRLHVRHAAAVGHVALRAHVEVDGGARVGGEEFDMRKFDAAFNSLEELSSFARQRGVEILLENIPNELSSAERLIHFLAITHLDLGFVFDTGHAHMGPGIEGEFDIMKDRMPVGAHAR